MTSKKITIKDCTLREGLDVPNVNFSLEQRLEIAKLLEESNVPEIEVVAPSRVLEDLEFPKKLKEKGLRIRTSGLIYAHNPFYQEEIEKASIYLDRYDILMPLSQKRKPYDKEKKIKCLLDALGYALAHHSDVGVGFPHSTQTEVSFLLRMYKEAVMNSARRVTIYDTNGSKDPFEVHELIKKLKSRFDGPLFFHGHNDLGLATANSLAAVYAGANGLDVTVNGLGDRAGNASFEQVVLNLYLKGFNTRINIKHLKRLSEVVKNASRIEIHKLAPIVGKYSFSHKSPSHLENPELFEAFNPELITKATSRHLA